MENCEHNFIHTEKMVRKEGDSYTGESFKSVIVKFCADCGKKLREVDIQP